jgi:GntR family transcriptional regulator
MHLKISNTSDVPIYLQLFNQIKDQIINGQLKEMEPLPSIRSLAKELNISVITTKRAYDDLEREGFIVTVAGKGSFVAPINRQMVREEKLKLIEERLTEAVETARLIGLSLEELRQILNLIYEEG